MKEADISQSRIEKDEEEAREIGVKIVDKVMFRKFYRRMFAVTIALAIVVVLIVIMFVSSILIDATLYDNIRNYCVNNHLSYEECRSIVLG